MTAPTPAPPATSEISLVEAVWRYRLMSSLIVVACVLASVAATAFLLGGATATARFAVTDPTNNNNVLRQGVVSGPGYAAYTAQRAAFAGSAAVLGRASEIIRSKHGPSLTAAALRGAVKTSTKPDSGVVIVNASGGDMPEAALIANAVVQAYQEETIATATAKLDTQLKNIQNSEREITRNLETTPASTREGRVLASNLAKLQSQESGVLSARANANDGVQFVDSADPGASTPNQLPQNAVIGLAIGAILACVISFLRATSGGPLRRGGSRRPAGPERRIERVWTDEEVYGPTSRPALPAGHTAPNPIVYPDPRQTDSSRNGDASSRRSGTSRSGEISPRHADTYPRHGDTSSRRGAPNTNDPYANGTSRTPNANSYADGTSRTPGNGAYADGASRTSPTLRADGTSSFTTPSTPRTNGSAPATTSRANGTAPRKDATATPDTSPRTDATAYTSGSNGTGPRPDATSGYSSGTSAYSSSTGTGTSGTDAREAGTSPYSSGTGSAADGTGPRSSGTGSRADASSSYAASTGSPTDDTRSRSGSTGSRSGSRSRSGSGSRSGGSGSRGDGGSAQGGDDPAAGDTHVAGGGSGAWSSDAASYPSARTSSRGDGSGFGTSGSGERGTRGAPDADGRRVAGARSNRGGRHSSDRSSDPLGSSSDPLAGSADPLGGVSDPLAGSPDPLGGSSDPLSGDSRASDPLAAGSVASDPLKAGSRTPDPLGGAPRASDPLGTGSRTSDASDSGAGSGFGRAPELGAPAAGSGRADAGSTASAVGEDGSPVASGRARRTGSGRSRSGGTHSRGSSREDGSFRDPAKALETGLASTPPPQAAAKDKKDGAPGDGKGAGSRIPVDLWTEGSSESAGDPGRTVEDLRIVDDAMLAAARLKKSDSAKADSPALSPAQSKDDASAKASDGSSSSQKDGPTNGGAGQSGADADDAG